MKFAEEMIQLLPSKGPAKLDSSFCNPTFQWKEEDLNTWALKRNNSSSSLLLWYFYKPTFSFQMKIPQHRFDSEAELHTWLEKIKLAFKGQHIDDQDEMLNVALQHLEGPTHTWGEKWIAKNPKGNFNEFANALT